MCKFIHKFDGHQFAILRGENDPKTRQLQKRKKKRRRKTGPIQETVLHFFPSLSGCVYHHTSGVELRFPTTFRVIFADDKRKAVLIRGLETPFFCFYAF